VSDDFLDVRLGPGSSAVFSRDGKYRYRLGRVWDATRMRCGFVMLNPSTADERVLDPTVRRCVALAKAWGYGSVDVGNLFALRSTDPRALSRTNDPVGPMNDRALSDIRDACQLVVIAWGNHGTVMNRAGRVLDQILDLRRVSHLGWTREGQPRHPLYVRSDVLPMSCI
jgi:hypothetical protein